jgi:DNA-directed RNA polymerase subunit RPC12/RpoP
MSLKRATLEPFAVDVICPYCGELCENEEGGLMWTVDDLEPGTKIDCSNCEEKFLIPSRVKSVSLTS